MSRLPRSRWTRIAAWTGAALAWGTTLVMAKENAQAETGETGGRQPRLQTDGLAGKTVQPDAPGKGLVVLRYVPIPTPAQQVITRVVTRTVSAGSAPSGGSSSQGSVAAPANPVSSGGSSGAAGGGGGTSNTAPPPPPPTPVTTAPAPVSGGS